jgi:hypothetical protein
MLSYKRHSLSSKIKQLLTAMFGAHIKIRLFKRYLKFIYKYISLSQKARHASTRRLGLGNWHLLFAKMGIWNLTNQALNL